MFAEVFLEIVVIDGFQCRSNMIGGQRAAQTKDARVQFAEQLVGEAADTVLVFVRVHIVEPLDVELAVPEL